MALLVKVVHGTVPVSPGVQNVSVSLGGLTPKAVELMVVGCTALATRTENVQLSVGFSEGTNNVCVSNVIRSASSSNYKYLHTTKTALLTNETSDTIIVDGTVSGFSANQVSINWAVTGGGGNLFVLKVYAGADITHVAAGAHQLNATTSPSTETLGWRPTLVKMLSSDKNSYNAPQDTSQYNFIGHNYLIDSSNKEMAVEYRGGPWGGAYINSQMLNAALYVTSDVLSDGAITGTGFTVTHRETPAAGPYKLPFLALALSGTPQVNLVTFSSPTSPGDVNVAFGFTPEYIEVCHILGAAYATSYETVASTWGIGIGASDGTTHMAFEITDEAYNDPGLVHHGKQTLRNDKLVSFYTAYAGSEIAATLSSLGSNTVLNYSTTPGSVARVAFALGLASSGAGGGGSGTTHPGAALLF